MLSRSRYTSRVHAGARFVAQRGLLKPLVWRLVTVTVLGEENLKGLNRPFVIVSNHASHLDAPLIFGSMPRKLSRYVAAGAAAGLRSSLLSGSPCGLRTARRSFSSLNASPKR